MLNYITVKEGLQIAEKTGQQVTIILKSGKKFECVIVELLCPTFFRIWIEPNKCRKPKPGQESCQCPEAGHYIEKAIVSICAVEYIDFNPEASCSCIPMVNNTECCHEAMRDTLNDALITRQIVKVGLDKEGCSIIIKGCIKNLTCNIFTIKSDKCCSTQPIPIRDVEFVIFSSF